MTERPPKTTTFLAADVGGTKTLLGLFDEGLEPLVTRRYPTAEHASIDAAKGWVDRQIHDAREWAGKPAIEQAEDLAENTGDAMIPHPLTVGTAVITGGLGRKMLGAVGELEEVAQAGNTLNKAETKAAQAIRAAERKASSPGKMQQEVLRGQAPRDIHRVDRPHVTSGESHVHFCNGTSCNQSGTIHDAHKGAPNPSTAAREWLEQHGWTRPKNQSGDP